MQSQLREHLRFSRITIALSLGLPLLTACEATTAAPPESSSSSPSTVSVAINPMTATATEGGSLSYVATVKGAANTAVRWSVQEGTTGGSITSSGAYTAPNTLGTYHVVATSVADPTVSASAVVYVLHPPVTSPSVSVAITPSTTTVPRGGLVSYVATVQGVTNTAVTWSVQEGTTGGSITSSGVYTAPNTFGIYHVIATSVADPTVSASAVVSVEVPSVSVYINPSAATVREGRSVPYFVTVTGAANTTVTWSVQEGATGGSITSSGVYTAPNTLGTYHVVATSVANPAASASAVVTTYFLSTMDAGTFAAVGDMTTARAYHTATPLANGKVLIAGGWDGHQTLASAELYDPSTRTFASTGSMITPRAYHSATLLADGRVLITGGCGPVKCVLTAEIYDPSTGAFTNTGDLILDSGPTTLLPDGRVLVAAGNNAEIYDPHSGTFTLTGPFVDPGPIYPSTATLLTNGKVLVTGCVLIDPADGCSVVVVAELFDPQSGTFNRTGPMTPSPYSNATDDGATLLADGRVLFVGDDGFGYGATDVEVYDPATGTFASPGSTIRVGEDATETRLTDGTVLIAGGSQGGVGDGIPDAELFVPASGTFESAGEMTVGRYFHTATLLPDGTVLITGGYSDIQQPPVSSAEVYKPR